VDALVSNYIEDLNRQEQKIAKGVQVIKNQKDLEIVLRGVKVLEKKSLKKSRND